jgi:hypothetical protein
MFFKKFINHLIINSIAIITTILISSHYQNIDFNNLEHENDFQEVKKKKKKKKFTIFYLLYSNKNKILF